MRQLLYDPRSNIDARNFHKFRYGPVDGRNFHKFRYGPTAIGNLRGPQYLVRLTTEHLHRG
jgi:hypothetical protein